MSACMPCITQNELMTHRDEQHLITAKWQWAPVAMQEPDLQQTWIN